MELTENHFTLLYGVILHPAPDWAVQLYGQQSMSKGDAVFRSAIIAMATADEDLLDMCVYLLNNHKRWPDDLNHDGDAKSFFEQYLDAVLTRYNRWASRKNWRPILPWRKRYRYQKGMTRDPYTMVFVAWDVLKEGPCPLRVPWYIKRPGFTQWIHYMKTGKEKWKRRYERIDGFFLKIFNEPGYAKHLDCWKAWAANSVAMKKALEHEIPHWNYVCRLLIDHPLNYLAIDMMRDYRSRTGLLWTSDVYQTPNNSDVEWLPETEKYRLDKQELDFLLQSL